MRPCSNSSDQSEVSDSSVNNRTCFRASVCLRRYFQDHRERCYMLVPQRRRVRWLERRIKKVFSITDDFCLRTNGHLLPTSESLALLCPGDSIEVIPLNEDKNGDSISNGNIKEKEFLFVSTRAMDSDNFLSNGRGIIQNQPQGNVNMETSTKKSSRNVDDCNRSEYHNSGDNRTPLRTESYRTESIRSSTDETNAKQNTFLEADASRQNIFDEADASRQNTFDDADASRQNTFLHANASKQNTFDEADGSLDTLQEMKRQALKLLGSSGPARRSRRRVRRRRARCSPSDVQRNDAAYARPPRVVAPLAAD